MRVRRVHQTDRLYSALQKASEPEARPSSAPQKASESEARPSSAPQKASESEARRLELRERFSHLADGAQHAKSPFAHKVDEYDVSAQFSAPGALQGRSGVWVSTQLTVDTLRHG